MIDLPKDEKLVVIINGRPTAGKDKFVEYVSSNSDMINKKVGNYSSVGNVKASASILGWDGTKTDDNRNALSELKVISESLWNGTTNYMLNMIENNNNHITFLHIREIESINKMVGVCNENGYKVITLYVDRDVEVTADNEGDCDALYPELYPYAHIIDNNNTLYDLENKAKNFLLFVSDLSKIPTQTKIELKDPKELDVVYVSLSGTFDTYGELLNACGNINVIKENLARFSGAKIISEHCDNRHEIMQREWKFPVDFPHNELPRFGSVGVFDYDSNWNSLVGLLRLSEYDGTVYLNDRQKTFECVALHIHNTKDIEDIDLPNM
ncbi:hypothetical protein HYO65_gp139 [Tenacibaculum phage PTm1]|uniref:Uncharacterized protein n=2 Tax=Shirahamavirus PTm1 TaxID=2846435 RepID=A0A5S9BZ21_9CAUD|nr:hypothetical protein HYO65_gp139 [Tenacibaculum phage PTm1]BBI90531.1 hypothetical protein [Tenacibaculum phage PTm1]BBI90839.1 hypothetical protein [Tenacibaculum phage PTm5]